MRSRRSRSVSICRSSTSTSTKPSGARAKCGFAKNCKKSEYHVVDELHGALTLSNSGLDEKAPPVLTDGTFWCIPAAAAPGEDRRISTEEAGNKATSKPAAAPSGKPKGGGGGGGRKGGALPGSGKKRGTQ